MEIILILSIREQEERYYYYYFKNIHVGWRWDKQ